MGENKVYSTGVVVSYHIDSDYVLTQNVADGEDAIAVAPTATKKDYSFVGWRQDTEANSTVLGKQVVASDEAFSLYAVFKKSTEVSFFASGGKGEMENLTVVSLYNNGTESGEQIELPLCSYTKEGYAFIGYTLDTSKELLLPGTKMGFSEETVLYANWVQETYEFVYTGSYFTFVVPASGIYNLDVYGARAGNINYLEMEAKGGLGGRANGYIYLEKNATLYICIG